MEPLLKENAQLRKQLNDCTSRLMQLSGSIHQITDADIQQNFQDLHSMIESALTTFLELDGRFDGWDKLFKGRLDEAVCNLAGIPRDLFSDHLQATPGPLESSPDGFAWLSKQECCDCLVTSRMVWRFLKQRVFDKRHLPSGLGLPNVDEITSEDSDLIQDIFQLLVRGSRDVAPSSHTPSWEPEALKAIRQLPGFSYRQEKLVETLASALCDELRQCISSENPNELNHFCHACVQLALEMVTNMACSSQTYEVLDGPMLQTELPRSKLGEWKLLSISSWRAPRGAVDWKPVIALAPGLYNGTRLDDGPLGVALVKPLWVIFEEGPAKTRPYGAVVDDDQSFSLEPGTSTTAESASDTTQGKHDLVSSGSSHKDPRKGTRGGSKHKDVGLIPPASPQGYSKTSRTSEGRGKAEKDQRWERKKDHRSRRHRPADHPPSREGSRSSAAESESSGLDSITNTTKYSEPQELRTRAHASNSDAHHPFTLDIPRRAATEPDARRSSTADRTIGAKASKESAGGGRGDVKRRGKQQYYNTERVRTTSYGPTTYSSLLRRLPTLWPAGRLTR